jgi:putative transposase
LGRAVSPNVRKNQFSALVDTLRYAVNEYVENHYLHERPHQDNLLLFPQHTSDPLPRDGPILCSERLGGLLKFYHRKAAAY